MPTYISMLRGINLGPHNRMKMGQLRDSLAALGFKQVQTYVQSGNVIFKAAKSPAIDLSRRIEERILAEFGFPVAVDSRTPEEMGKTIQNNPFLKKRGVDSSRLHVTFLSQAPAPSAVKKLAALSAGPDQFRYSGREIYVYCPNGYGTTKLSNNAFERVLEVRATTRNWNTVNKVYEIALECD